MNECRFYQLLLSYKIALLEQKVITKYSLSGPIGLSAVHKQAFQIFYNNAAQRYRRFQRGDEVVKHITASLFVLDLLTKTI